MPQITPGFYHHYKHKPDGPINNYAYEVVGVGHHTEERGTYVVVYRPLYDAYVYLHGRMYDIRPYDMFTGQVVKDGVEQPRFRLITDPDVIAQLEAIRDEMYSA